VQRNNIAITEMQAPAMKKQLLPLIYLASLLALFSCKKGSEAVTETYQFNYPDSVFYLQPRQNDYIVGPVQPRSGTYSAFPEGLEVDPKTGAINVSKSETGLRYRIDFTADDGQRYSTKVVISGINYADRYYYLDQNDTVVNPIYNADPARALPIAGSVFDEGSLANSSGCSMGTVDGKINLASSIRQGLFGKPAQFGATTEVETKYRLNDGSNKAQNGLKVKFYYYKKKSDVPQYLLDLLKDRDGMFLRTALDAPISKSLREAAAKPRPPCIIVIAAQ
jgi:hypothetical protein